jgi:hypothetical protein
MNITMELQGKCETHSSTPVLCLKDLILSLVNFKAGAGASIWRERYEDRSLEDEGGY